MGEKSLSVVEKIRKAVREGNKRGGAGIPDEILFVPKDNQKVVRWLSEFDEPVIIRMHDKFKFMYPQPCFKYYGKKCPFDAMDGEDGFRTDEFYFWTVYDYESEAKKILMARPGGQSPVEDMLEMFEANGTLKDRDYKIIRVPAPKGTKYKVRPVQGKPTKYEGKKNTPYSEEKVFAVAKGLITKTKTEDQDEGPGGNDDED